MTNPTYELPTFAGVVIILAIVGFGLLNLPDHRGIVQRVVDSFHALPEGFDSASQQLRNRTPAQKLSEAVKHDFTTK